MADLDQVAIRTIWFNQLAALLAECTSGEGPLLNVHGAQLNLVGGKPNDPVQTAIDVLLGAHEPDYMSGLTRVDATCACRTCAPTYRRLALLTCP